MNISYFLNERNDFQLNKFHFFVIRLKNHILPLIFLLFTICLVLFSNLNLSAAKKGLELWVNSVIPSLFPFFVATELLSRTDIPHILGRIFNRFMLPLFNIRGEGSFAFIMGIISGYPTGAKIASDFRNKNILSKAECERLLSFTNNSGPLFIIGTVGISMFGSSLIGFLLFITHILGCITVGIIFRFWKRYSNINLKNLKYETSKNKIRISKLGSILSESISNSIYTIVIIGGFVVLFSVIISILNASHITLIANNFLRPFFNILDVPTDFITPIITGILEITNGISMIADVKIKEISLNIIFTAFLLGFGGISVFLQVWSVVSKTDLSIKPYIIGKFLHSIFSAFYTFLFIYCFPIFNLNL